MTTGSTAYVNHSYDFHEPGSGSGKVLSKTRLALLLLVASIVGLVIGLLVGKFALCDDEDKDGLYLPGVPEGLISEENPEISQKIMDMVEPSRIEDNLRQLTRKPHIAGQENDFALVSLLQTRFKEYGLSEVQTTPYKVLLSYPSEETPNSVRLLNGTGHILYDAARDESNMSKIDDVVPPFNAYSPSRLVEGRLVYVNYGRVEDYYKLKEMGINVTGCVVIVRYGKIFRGDKVDIAASNGATGIILYTDPADFTGVKMGDDRIYPETWWMPPTGAQRGTIFTGDGDPLTPGYPANNLSFRYPEDEVEPSLPKIPSHPIGYGAAVHILEHLAGPEVPAEWKGALNITYKLGPEFTDNNWKIQLNVTTKNRMAKAENVFGIIKGAVEPDRYVLFGNHRDAWIYGAIDPSSGTAVLLELARVMGKLFKDGTWKPRRSIIFCSWGAEEYGLLGSTEWVEQYVATLRERVIGYINVDIAVKGNDTLDVSATPLMHNIIIEATKKVKTPKQSEIDAGRKTVYDTWLHFIPQEDSEGKSLSTPRIGSLGSGSDYAPLLQRAGITAIDMSYTYDKKKYMVSGYALYHTEYETFDIVKSQFDRNFEVHAAIARVSGEVARHLADSYVLPFKITNYAIGLENNRKALDSDYGANLTANIENYDLLKTVISEFAIDALNFEERVEKVDRNNPLAVRLVNDQIMLLERAFLDPFGLPTRPFKKHLIFAENANDAYAGSSFPGLVDLLFEIDQEPDRWEDVRHHFSVILHTIQSAGATLRDVTSFMSEKL